MTTMTPRLRAMVVLWPAFLVAGVLESLVFALVDPGTLRWFGQAPVSLSPAAVYTLAFFVFWAAISLAGLLMLLLERSADEVNHPARRTAPHWPR